jgi:predicted amidohydrolase
MKIALAQIGSVRGDIDANSARHERFVERAAAQGAEMIVFPELSLSQYEPTIADSVAMLPDDPRLTRFQALADAYAGGAAVYIASVAKTPTGVVKAHEQLAKTAREYGMTVLMVNCVGTCEGKPAGGQSAIWDAQGKIVASLGVEDEGLLIS